MAAGRRVRLSPQAEAAPPPRGVRAGETAGGYSRALRLVGRLAQDVRPPARRSVSTPTTTSPGSGVTRAATCSALPRAFSSTVATGSPGTVSSSCSLGCTRKGMPIWARMALRCGERGHSQHWALLLDGPLPRGRQGLGRPRRRRRGRSRGRRSPSRQSRAPRSPPWRARSRPGSCPAPPGPNRRLPSCRERLAMASRPSLTWPPPGPR